MNFIGCYTDQVGTLEVLRQDMRDRYILGFSIVPAFAKNYWYDVYTEWNPHRIHECAQ